MHYVTRTTHRLTDDDNGNEMVFGTIVEYYTIETKDPDDYF